MSALRDQRRRTRDLVRLREVRMRAAAGALAEARAAAAEAERRREDADHAAEAANTRHTAAHANLAAGPAEAERLLAVLDQRRFQQSVARQTLADARATEHARAQEEAVRRKAMIVAHARYDVLAERLSRLARRAERQDEERAAIDAEDTRRFR